MDDISEREVLIFILPIFPKKEILDPETETVKKTLSNLGYKNIEELILSKQIKLSFKNLNEEDCLYQSKLMCDQILVNTNIQDYEISLLKKD